MGPKRAGLLFSRRLLLRGAGTALVATPLVGCSSSSGAAGTDSGVDAEADVDADVEADVDADETADAGPPWATGGTAGMKDKANYPNPFAGPVDPTCALLCAADRGPCYSAQVEERQDISYGYLGLPTRLYFQVLDETCKPIPGASVDVWHTSPAGRYSGNDPVNLDATVCTGNDADHVSHLYFRGKQTTDASGVVFFDTCFPGWYSQRTVHIHFTVRVAGTDYVTGQVFFDDALNEDILTSQELYKDRGRRDTTNALDIVAFVNTVARYTLQTRKMTDGALLAWKSLIVRAPSQKDLCFLPFREQ